ncbi:hypothetical protein H4R19_005595, partial [Coemansia spiralis]
GGQTYQVHTAHTSNSLYVAERGAAGALELHTVLHQTLELQPVHPQIRARVIEVLGWEVRGAFRGAEFDAELPDGGPNGQRHATDQALARHVQAGDAQLRRVLADIPAFRHATTGHWRAIDPAYCLELLRLILATQVERGWALDALDAQQVYSALHSDAGGDGVLSEAVEAVLGRFGEQRGPGVYAIDGTRVARFIAGQVFAAEGARPWPVADFLAALRATLPPQLPPIDALADPAQWGSARIPQSLLRGMAYASALVESRLLYTAAGLPASATLLHPLDRASLPPEPRPRLQRLFEIKRRWSASEIRPFLEDLAGVDVDHPNADGDATAQAAAAATKTVDSWLLKFGRGVRSPDGEMIYSSRLGILFGKMVQSLNMAAVRSAWALVRRPALLEPRLTVADIRAIPFEQLRRAGIRHIVFDKDNCLTAPYVDAIHPPFARAWRECRAAFPGDGVLIVSNSAGTADDRGARAAAAVEQALGAPVLRHREKKPRCGPEILARLAPAAPSEIAVVGDRLATDIALANLNGMLAIWTRQIVSVTGDNRAAAALRRLEHAAHDCIHHARDVQALLSGRPVLHQ